MLLSDVCLSVTCIGPKSRTVRPRKTKIATEVAHVTRDSDTTFAIFSGQGHQAALLVLALTREAAAAISVGTYWAWESTATLHLLGGARRGRRGAGTYSVAMCSACFHKKLNHISSVSVSLSQISPGVSRCLGKSFAFAVICLCMFRDGTW